MADPRVRTPFRIVVAGLVRVGRAPAVLAGAWLITAATALPLAITLHQAIAADLGSSMAAVQASQGVNWDWWQEFATRRPAVAGTFQPFIIGFAAVLANISAFLDGDGPEWPVAGAVAAYIAAWSFVLGGVLDRYARQRRTGVHGFFAVSGVFFFRFLRLGVLAASAWLVLFGPIHGALFEWLYPWLTRDLTVERTAFAWRMGLYLIFASLAALVMLLFDYARVRAVVEDRRSMVGALVASARFLRRHRWAAGGAFLINAALFGAVVAFYGLVAPRAPGGSPLALVHVVLVGQLYVLARLAVKLSFYASAVVLFQERLAHASYTAAPNPVWPDSPAVESLDNAAPRP
jgi:hypothetical protein